MILFPDIPGPLIERASEQMDREAKLFDCLPADDLDMAIKSAFAANLEASYAIENISLDSLAIKSSVIESFGLGVHAWKEKFSNGAREERAVAGTLALLDNRPLSHEALWEAHRVIENASDGYRDHGECVVDGRGRVVYQAPEAREIPKLMDDFVFWWNNARLAVPAPLGAALAHQAFVLIHPFADGNGRVARALADKAMIVSDATVFRPYSLSAAILDDKLGYYGALRSNDRLDFIRYMLGAHEAALESGFNEARRLHFLRLFLKRDRFTPAEREILSAMSTERRSRWRPDDYFGGKPADEYERAFRKLLAKGAITPEGRINVNYFPKGQRPR